jgi:hypothetical protein
MARPSKADSLRYCIAVQIDLRMLRLVLIERNTSDNNNKIKEGRKKGLFEMFHFIYEWIEWRLCCCCC